MYLKPVFLRYSYPILINGTFLEEKKLAKSAFSPNLIFYNFNFIIYNFIILGVRVFYSCIIVNTYWSGILLLSLFIH